LSIQKSKFSNREIVFTCVTVFLIVCRFASLFFLKDVFYDEECILTHISSVIQQGTDSSGNKWPLYAVVGDGYVTYPFLYPMALFRVILGEGSIVYKSRFILQILTIFSCWLTAKGVHLWTEDTESFWYTFLVALALPWGFVQANRIWDPAFVPLYFSIVFYSACKFFKQNLIAKSKSACEFFLFGGLVILAADYPPCRIPAVAIWIYLFVRAIQLHKFEKTDIIFVFVLSTILALPLAYYLFFVPEFNSRSSSLLVFQGGNPIKEIFTFLKNFFDLLSPTYLFITGDLVNRHSLPFFGMLGMVNLIAFAALFRKKYDRMDCFLLYTIF